MPGVPRRGHGRARLPRARSRRRRCLRPGTRRGRRRAARSPRRAGRPDGRPLGRDGQARRQRVPRHADLVHQRDRQRLRAGRRRRRGRRARDGPRPADRHAVPARRDRLRRLVLPEGRLVPEVARRQLGLPLPSRLVGRRGERAPDPPAGREGAAASRHAAREACRPARACVQGAHGRRSRGAEPGACRPVPGRGSTGRRLGPGRRRTGDPARCRVRGRRRRRARRRGRRRRRHRVARAPGAPVGRAPRDDAQPAGRRRPQLPRRRRDANGRLRLRGHGPRGLAVRRARGDRGARCAAGNPGRRWRPGLEARR